MQVCLNRKNDWLSMMELWHFFHLKRPNDKELLIMTHDTIETFKSGTIQHGKCNDRIYLIKFASDPSTTYPRDLIDLAKDNNYSKIFAKVPEHLVSIFAGSR